MSTDNMTLPGHPGGRVVGTYHYPEQGQQGLPPERLGCWGYNQEMKMGYTSATYHLNFGLSRTEKRKLDKELNSVSFSASLDAGSKGNKKRMEILV